MPEIFVSPLESVGEEIFFCFLFDRQVIILASAIFEVLCLFVEEGLHNWD